MVTLLESWLPVSKIRPREAEASISSGSPLKYTRCHLRASSRRALSWSRIAGHATPGPVRANAGSNPAATELSSTCAYRIPLRVRRADQNYFRRENSRDVFIRECYVARIGGRIMRVALSQSVCITFSSSLRERLNRHELRCRFWSPRYSSTPHGASLTTGQRRSYRR